MTTIYKYILEHKSGEQSIELREPGLVLGVIEQNDNIMLYAIANDGTEETTTVKIRVVLTGWNAGAAALWQYLGTVSLKNGQFICHVFIERGVTF